MFDCVYLEDSSGTGVRVLRTLLGNMIEVREKPNYIIPISLQSDLKTFVMDTRNLDRLILISTVSSFIWRIYKKTFPYLQCYSTPDQSSVQPLTG